MEIEVDIDIDIDIDGIGDLQNVQQAPETGRNHSP